MRSVLKVLVGIFGVVGAVGFATQTQAAELYEVQAEYLFVPNGFDDNDQAEVVLDGWLQTSCDKIAKPKVKFMLEQNLIQVQAMAKRGHYLCAPVMSRYTVVVPLGRLPYGVYKVETNRGLMVESMLVEESSSSGPDEFIYAKVDEAFVDYAPEFDAAGRWSVVISGNFRSSCEKMDKILLTQQDRSFQVQPIIKEEGEVCVDILEPYVARVFLEDDDVLEGRYLAHVRSFGGKSLNRVFNGR
jgi:hypothetical protein